MAAKPSSPFSWATAGTRIAASLAKVAVGFVPRERPGAQLLNDILAQIGDWTAYLSGGAFSGNHTIDGSLTVGGQPLTVASTAFTANNINETFTSTGINLQTGDGPLQVSTTGTLPSGLAAATDYWAIRLTTSTFKLATTFSNAIAGTNLLIATDGTGTQSIVSTGSTTRPADLTSTRSLSALGNATLGGTVSIGGATAVGGGLTLSTLAAATDDRPLYIDSAGVVKKGHASRAYSYTFLGAMLGATDIAAGATIAAGGTTGSVVITAVNPGTTSASINKGIDGLPKGFRVTSIRVRVNTSASANGYDFFASNPSNVGFVSNAVAGDHTFTITLGTPLTVGDNTTMCFTVSTSHLNDVFIGFDVIGDES